MLYWTGAALMTVPVQMESNFTRGTPEILFEGNYVTGFGRSYDVMPDGQRFLMIKEGTPEESGVPPSLILVQNWFEELRRLVPVN